MNKKLIKLGVIEPNRKAFEDININNLDGQGDGGGSGSDAAANAQALADHAAKVAAENASSESKVATTEGDNNQNDEQQELLSEYGGTGFDGEGNMLNASGEVVKTAAELSKSTSVDEGHTIDESGNLLDPEGNVLGPADSFEVDDEGNYIIPEVPLISTIQSSIENELGVSLTDETGNPIQFEDTETGITNMVQTAAAVLAEKEKANWLSTFPDLEKYYTHIAAGNSKESFFSIGNQWRETQLPSADVTTEEANSLRKNVIVEEFLKNYDYDNATADQKTALRNRATKLVGLYEDEGTLAAEATNSLKGLQSRESALEDARDSKNKARIEADKAARAEYWNNLTQTVNSGDLGDISIPQVDRQAFLDYIGKDVTGNGQSQEMLDMQDEDPAKTLQLSYLRYKKFSLGHLVSLRKQTAKANTLSQKRSRSVKVASVQGKRSSQSSTKINLSDININNTKFT